MWRNVGCFLEYHMLIALEAIRVIDNDFYNDQLYVTELLLKKHIEIRRRTYIVTYQ